MQGGPSANTSAGECKDCGGTNICEHQRFRSQCRAEADVCALSDWGVVDGSLRWTRFLQENTTKPYLGGYYGSNSSPSDSSELSRPLAPCLAAAAPRDRVLVSVWGWVVLMPPATRLIDTIREKS